MGFVHGKNARIWIWNTAGACQNISGDKNAVTMSWTRDNPETTTFGSDGVNRIAGLYDAVLSGTGIYNTTDTTGIDAVMTSYMTSSAIALIQFAPAGSQSGSPLYSGCMVLSKYNINATVKTMVAVDWEFQLASGSITVASCT